MIFQKDHIKMICEGVKTQTRRVNRGIYQEGKAYAIQPCRTCKGLESYRIVIDAIWQEVRDDEPGRTNTKLMPVTLDDARDEGGYTQGEFEEIFKKLNPKWVGRTRWVFKFHVVNVVAADKNVV